MATTSTTPKRAFGKLFNAIAIAAALCASSASQADVLDFETPQDAPFVIPGNVLTFGEYRVEAIADFGALITNDDCAGGLQCPVNNPTTYYGALNDGYFVFGKTDDSKFKISNLDASFIGAQNSPYAAVSALLYVAGYNGNTFVKDIYLSLAGPVNGQFQFANFQMGAFSNFEFTDVLVAGFACDLAGNCNRNTNQANFAVDNITTFVPEPGSFALLGLGLLGLGAASRRRAAKA